MEVECRAVFVVNKPELGKIHFESSIFTQSNISHTTIGR